MSTIYRLKASELDERFLAGLKSIFGDKEIEIISEHFLPSQRRRDPNQHRTLK